MTTLFADLKNGGYLKQVSREAFAERAAWFWSELNAIHPFREGNGRTQTLFFGRNGTGWGLVS